MVGKSFSHIRVPLPRGHSRLFVPLNRSWSLAGPKGTTRETRDNLATKNLFSDTKSLAAQLRRHHYLNDASATKRAIATTTISRRPLSWASRSERVSGASPPVAHRHGPLAAAARPRRDVPTIGGRRAGPSHPRWRSRRGPTEPVRWQG